MRLVNEQLSDNFSLENAMMDVLDKHSFMSALALAGHLPASQSGGRGGGGQASSDPASTSKKNGKKKRTNERGSDTRAPKAACRQFAAGTCTYGSNCRFAHTSSGGGSSGGTAGGSAAAAPAAAAGTGP